MHSLFNAKIMKFKTIINILELCAFCQWDNHNTYAKILWAIKEIIEKYPIFTIDSETAKNIRQNLEKGGYLKSNLTKFLAEI